MERAFEQQMIEQGAPTLMGIKPANLFRYFASETEQVFREVSKWKRRLKPYGVSVEIIKVCPRTKSYLVYIYRRSSLEKILKKQKVCKFLEASGYCIETETEGLLAQLSERLCLEDDFPHEIGIFLGYPLCDVIGFIENKGKNYTCCGCWKAYGDPREARRRFNAYRICTKVCKARFEQGTSVIQLVVAA